MPDILFDGPDPRKVNGLPPTNGDGFAILGSAQADSHGRAALLLVESLIHELVGKAVLTRGEAIDIIDIAVDVEEELAWGAGQVPSRRRGSALAPLAATFRRETGE